MTDDTLPTLGADETLRYSRHLILPEVGPAGQRRLKAARVLLIGAGGLGSPAALYLAAAGVGTLGIVDFDTVDESNLQRQIIHGTADVGRTKLDSATDRIIGINPHVRVEPHSVRLESANARQIIRGYDVVIDGSDNFPTRYLVNDACVLEGKPCVYGSILRWDGQASVFWAQRGPCYRCLFPEPPPPGSVPSCAEAGVFGVLPGIIGSVQALEALKLILDTGEPLIGRLLLFDALRMRFREMRLRRDPACPVCGDNPTVRELIDYERFCGIHPPGAPTDNEMIPEITPTELKQRLDRGDRLTIIDVREPMEWDIGNLEPQGARLIPLAQVPERLDEISPDEEIVLQCRSGARSGQALQYLQAQGYERVLNLRGGILAWSDEVDPTIPKY
ncbi:molybdopterin-synthase adenylyltransferase MoeB [Longimicrobium terrae]|uniref:Molybdopterin-synthase adenylyltransferase n=1 Tax=Longimicrobium terrae TaxID=1639882 RepID=A0A841H0L5_9BACT|nr:molybdopterin-synthase adenylyltransferase MoeB [Longimicrobium terrae]MBB4637197.1 adenylyltransferase/sulfurtransferase [Longimicrobium terrae]MBB6071542.1 adenylyltransferase/sulfurtransferase [Longimicrobium terrae]